MPRTPQHFCYTRALITFTCIYCALISICSAGILLYIAFFRLSADQVMLRAVCSALGLYIPFLIASRIALYFRHITLDPQGMTITGLLSRSSVAWADIYVLERISRHTPGAPDLNALYAVVVNTRHGRRELVVCDEMLPDYKHLIDQIHLYVPRIAYREL